MRREILLGFLLSLFSINLIAQPNYFEIEPYDIYHIFYIGFFGNEREWGDVLRVVVGYNYSGMLGLKVEPHCNVSINYIILSISYANMEAHNKVYRFNNLTLKAFKNKCWNFTVPANKTLLIYLEVKWWPVWATFKNVSINFYMGETEEGNVGLKVWLSTNFKPQISSFWLKIKPREIIEKTKIVEKTVIKKDINLTILTFIAGLIIGLIAGLIRKKKTK